VIEPSASVGRGTRVWHHAHIRTGVFVDSGARVGSRVKLENNVSVYRGVTIEDEVLVGPSAVFTNDLYPRAVAPEWKVVPTVIRRGATIGANATIVCGNEIGCWATVGAGAVVVRPVEDHELVVGNPAHRAGWVCTCGRVLARTSERPDDMRCDDCRRAGSAPMTPRPA
jgi:UDP-2-acetamido-3-amino-2,3-dideoxy-glucuronate N-acetyltransferase